VLLGSDVPARRALAFPEVGTDGEERVVLGTDEARQCFAHRRVLLDAATPQERRNESLGVQAVEDLDGGDAGRHIGVRKSDAHRDREATSSNEDRRHPDSGHEDDGGDGDEVA